MRPPGITHRLRAAIAGVSLGLVCSCPAGDAAAQLRFAHHFVDRTLPVADPTTGDYGLTALADLDRDGDLDFVTGGRCVPPSTLYWYEFQAPDRWQRHVVGTNYLSDVGLAAHDVDRDGWVDLVCSGVWYRNTGQPRADRFTRLEFDPAAGGAHDVLVADLDGDRREDIVLMGDARTALRSLRWYSIPKDPRQPWAGHEIGPAVHGAITPGGAADLDADGDLDLLRANTWFENADGRALRWIAHANLPMGRPGPYGICVRTAVVDLDGDGQAEIVMADADITGSKVAILTNVDRQGGSWRRQDLPQTFEYGSLHSLAVADLNGDRRPEIIVNEQEELLPAGRRNPRWVVWENLGQGAFAERVILDQALGGHELQAGDVDGDGDIDLCSKPWGPQPWNGAGGAMHVDWLENLLRSRHP
ncbi:MAG: VCBS repeat-containing protein [Verrucomicrobiales bacterium]|nr:VCBS repeat-containing protein [Verrucomicrobiales bacterium]